MTQHLVRTLAAMLRTLRAEAECVDDLGLYGELIEAIIVLERALGLAQRRDGK